MWWFLDPGKLAAGPRGAIGAPSSEVYLSAASAWELSIKHALGKLELPEPPRAYVPKRMAAQAMTSLPVLQTHALHVATLPPHHTDPFDRLLVAQAMLEGLTLVTADPLLLPYVGVEILWASRQPPPPAFAKKPARRRR